MVECSCYKNSGEKCTNKAKENSYYCGIHKLCKKTNHNNKNSLPINNSSVGKNNTNNNLKKTTVKIKDLRDQLKAFGCVGYSNLSKEELIKQVNDIENCKKKLNKNKETSTKETSTKETLTKQKDILHSPNSLRDYLVQTCSDSRTCIAFGTNVDKIKDFFENFKNKTYLIDYATLTGGANGNIYLLKYNKLNYVAYTILKNTKYDVSDNILYEYIVGLFINKFHKKFPCFLETYNLFFSDNLVFSDMEYTNIIDTNSKKHTDTKQLLNLINKSCTGPTKINLEIEYVSSPLTMRQLSTYIPFWKNSIITSLIQIYMPLSLMANVFTHNDLHTDNVLLYSPLKDGYIKYIYHLSSKETVIFNSEYIVKIIDYGRSYFKDYNGYFRVASSAYLMIGDRWRISCNSGDSEQRRLVFEYRTIVGDDNSWSVGVPFIQNSA
jgi:molecular chaperone GrpE (heat shock protein)